MKKQLLIFYLLLCSLILSTQGGVHAQQSKLTNVEKPWTLNEFPTIQITNPVLNGYTGTTVSSLSDIIDGNVNTTATVTLVSSNTSAICATISSTNVSNAELVITDNNQYDSNNYISLVLERDHEVLTNVSDFTARILVSNTGNVNDYTPLNRFQIESALLSSTYKLHGYAPAAYRYVKIEINQDIPTSCRSEYNYNIAHINMRTQKDIVLPVCNTRILVNNALPGFSSSDNQLVNADTTDGPLINAAVGGTGVKYNGYLTPGLFVGFKISKVEALGGLLNISLLDDIEIRTYLHGVLQETKSSGQILLGVTLLNNSNQPFDVGLVLTAPADSVHITGPGVILSGHKVYGLVLKCYQDATTIACNEYERLTLPKFPIEITKFQTGLATIGLGSEGIVNIDNLLDNNANTYASFGTNVNLGTGSNIILKKYQSPFAANTFAGIELERVGVANLGVLSGMHIELYNNSFLVKSSAGTGLISLGVVAGQNRQVVGIMSDVPYDEIRLVMNNTIGASVLSELNLYNFVYKKFCASTIDLSCTSTNRNRLVQMTSPTYPLYVDGALTGVNALVGASLEKQPINFADNAIDDADTSNTSIDITALVGGSLTFAVADAVSNYPANTYVAFDISTQKLIDVSALNYIKISLIKDGSLIGTPFSPSLLAGVSLLNANEQRYKLGIVADQEFDGIQLSIEGVAQVGVLGTLKIHGVWMEQLCATNVTCNSTINLVQGEAPIIINNDRTGIRGLATVNLLPSEIEDIEALIDDDALNYTTVSGLVKLGDVTSISVLNPVQTYPAGSSAGFIVDLPASLIDLGLIRGIRISTYNDNALQESVTTANLLNLDLLTLNILGAQPGSRFVGINTTKPYDEIVIEFLGILDVDLDLTGTKIYGAYVSTNGVQFLNGGLCSNILPDVNVCIKNKVSNGDLSTNDFFSGNPIVTYGSGNPTTIYTHTIEPGKTATITLNQDGTYTVTATDTGVYNFEIPVVINDGLPVYSSLRITVIDDQLDENPVIANDDIAYIIGGATPTATLLNVLINDAAGNSNRPLTISSPSSAAGGSVLVSSGMIEYTPLANFYGIDTVYYDVLDATAPNGPINGAAKAVVYVYDPATVSGVNLVVATDDYVEVKSSAGVLSIPDAQGLLANDRLLGTGTLTMDASSIGTFYIDPSNPNVGTISIAANGSYTITPGSGMLASMSYPFVYSISNGGSAAASGTMYIMGIFDAALPITLVKFTADKVDCKNVNITWETASEHNVSHFEIEYSTTASHFITIATHEAKGEMFSNTLYTHAVSQSDRIGYYRLKTVDRDGTLSYSKIAQVKMINCDYAAYMVVPNPSNGSFTLHGNDESGKVQVMDITGKVIYEKTYESLTKVNIDITTYPTGTYHLRVITQNGKVEIVKLIKY